MNNENFICDSRYFFILLYCQIKTIEEMTLEDKELLLEDLCARLPYGTMLNISVNLFTDETFNARISTIDYCGEIKVRYGFEEYEQVFSLEQIKPYLFPLSSMTEEQKRELRQMDAFVNTFGQICFSTYDDYGHELVPTFEDAIRITNWLNKNHFDYRGLIDKGLAIDATRLNIY